MLGFGQKKIIFEYAGVYFYLMAGMLTLPPGMLRGATAVYGYHKGDEWVISCNIRTLIEDHDREITDAASAAR